MTRFSKAIVLINLSSSTATDVSGEMRALFKRYGYDAPTLLVGRSEDMSDLMDRMRQADGDLLISFGGDGTAAAVASIARERSLPFLPLPGGTMNVLMKGLYGTDQWQECLVRALATAAPRPMIAGRVTDSDGNDHIFMVGAIVGAATRMSEAREALREGQFIEALKGVFDTLKKSDDATPLQVKFTSETSQVELLNTVCPFMNGSALNPDEFHMSLVKTLSGGATLSLGVAAVTGEARANKAVETRRAASFEIASDKPIDVLLDGEPHQFDGPIKVKLDMDCGMVLAPNPAISFAQNKDTNTLEAQ